MSIRSQMVQRGSSVVGTMEAKRRQKRPPPGLTTTCPLRQEEGELSEVPREFSYNIDIARLPIQPSDGQDVCKAAQA